MRLRAIIDGLDRDGHDSALARDLLVILHKTLQMQEDHRERVTREAALGPASADYFTTRRPAA